MSVGEREVMEINRIMGIDREMMIVMELRDRERKRNGKEMKKMNRNRGWN